MDKKTAILMAGDLGTYKFALDSICENIVKPNNADVFILTSKGGFIHVSDEEFDGQNFSVQVDAEDEERLSAGFGSSLKGLHYVENIPDYTEQMGAEIKNLDNRILWLDKPNEKTVLYDAERGEFRHPAKYLDQYLRLRYLVEILNRYERKHNVKYDYIARVRIDQILDRKIIISNETDSREWLRWIQMDNFFYGTSDLMKEICFNFVSQIGGLRVAYVRDGLDFSLTQEPQFRKFVIDTVDGRFADLRHTGLNIGWRVFKRGMSASISDYNKIRQDIKSKKIILGEYLKFTEHGMSVEYPNFDTKNNIVWVYYIY